MITVKGVSRIEWAASAIIGACLLSALSMYTLSLWEIKWLERGIATNGAGVAVFALVRCFTFLMRGRLTRPEWRGIQHIPPYEFPGPPRRILLSKSAQKWKSE